jgi:type III restriction enzyme
VGQYSPVSPKRIFIEMKTLNQILDENLKLDGTDFYKNLVPAYVYSNLKEGFGKRSYQQEAFGRFIFYWNKYQARPANMPTQLLYHMATGSGKTLIMAGLMIYLYEKGYRNFLFFVNSSNIIDKTRDNFFNATSSKYLFTKNISIGQKQIRIKEVENFQAVNPDDINIVFSTIQGLHSRLNTPKENAITYDDFEDQKMVLISDEAHHINAETKKGNELAAEEKEEIISWEGTVNRIFNANAGNILLEFTATADLSLPEIKKKYYNKLIYDYPLKQFRIDGYSKEIKVLQADLSPFERALQGVLMSQYRRKIFEKYKKLVKPVILFKSKTIKDSHAFLEEFTCKIKKLKTTDLVKIKNANPDPAIEKVFQFLSDNNISLENLIAELKEDFSEEKLISVNSKNESELKQLAVNSLEDEANEYRAVFAVDKLNEGWDVLNLFDIVRLYDTKDPKNTKPGKTTMAEAQLIGRGARYCPFQITADQPFFGRKYDEDINNELRICEELYYHSAYNPGYIQELTTALEDIGIKAKENEKRAAFTEKNRKKVGLPARLPKKFSRQNIYGLSLSVRSITYKVALKTGYSKSGLIFANSHMAEAEKMHKKIYKLSHFDTRIIQKAINQLAFYQFSNLKKFLPRLNSISEFITSEHYLGNIQLEISGSANQIENLSSKEKLDVSIEVLESISKGLED